MRRGAGWGRLYTGHREVGPRPFGWSRRFTPKISARSALFLPSFPPSVTNFWDFLPLGSQLLLPLWLFVLYCAWVPISFSEWDTDTPLPQAFPQIAPHKVRKEECWGYRWKLHSHWNYFMGRHLPPDSWSPLVWVESERAESELTSSKGWKQLVCRKWWISSEFVFLCWLPPCFWFPVLRHSIYMCFLWSWEIGTRRKIYRELAKGWIYSFGVGGRRQSDLILFKY